MSIKKIVEAFGGITKATKVLGLKYPSIVQGWIKRNKIPDWRVSLVIDKMDELGIEIEALEGGENGGEKGC